MTDLLNGSPADPSATPPSPPASNPPQGQPADGGGWLASLPEEMRGLAEHKGWKDPADALRSYQHLEQAFGADRAGRALLAPKDADDKDGYDQIYKALGRPDDVDGYELNSIFGEEAVDENVLGSMAKAMHEAGLSKAQAHKMGAAYQEMYKAALAEAEAQYASEVEEAKASIPAETQETARRGFRMLRLPPDEARAISENLERALGPRAAVELFARLGAAIGEDRPIDGASPASGGASAELDRLLADSAFSSRYLSGDAGAMARINDLSRRAAEEQARYK